MGEIDGAINALREAVRLLPDSPEFHYSLGMALVAGQRQEDAAEVYRRAVQLKPTFVERRMSLNSALRAGAWMGSLEAHPQAVALRPQYSGAHNNLGLVLYTSGDLQGSLAEFHQAIALRADFASAWSNLGNVLRENRAA